MPSRRCSLPIICVLLFILVEPALLSGLVLPGPLLDFDFLSDVDKNRLTEIESLVDWAQMNAKVTRLDEFGGQERADGGRSLVFRFDDVRDTTYRESITAFLDMALQKKLKMTLGVVAGDFGAEPLLSLVRKGVQEGYFEVAIHGWLHENFTALGQIERIELIRNAKSKLQSLFPDTVVSTLIPPYEAVDAEVLKAAAASGLRYVTSDMAHGEPYEWDGVKFLPKTVDTAIPGVRPDDQWMQYDQVSIVNWVERSFRVYGYAMAVIHPQQLTRHWTAKVLSLILIGIIAAGVVIAVSFVALTRKYSRGSGRPGLGSRQRNIQYTG